MDNIQEPFLGAHWLNSFNNEIFMERLPPRLVGSVWGYTFSGGLSNDHPCQVKSEMTVWLKRIKKVKRVKY